MTNPPDDLFNRLFGIVSDVMTGPSPPPIPKSARTPCLRSHLAPLRELRRMAAASDQDELETYLALLTQVARSLEENQWLSHLSAEQIYKLDVGFHEVMKNTMEHCRDCLAGEPSATEPKSPELAKQNRQDAIPALLKQTRPHFERMRRELRQLNQASNPDDTPDLSRFIDALARALEIVGYNQELMAVETKAVPPPIPSTSDLLPDSCRLALTLRSKLPTAGEAQTLALHFRLGKAAE